MTQLQSAFALFSGFSIFLCALCVLAHRPVVEPQRKTGWPAGRGSKQ